MIVSCADSCHNNNTSTKTRKIPILQLQIYTFSAQKRLPLSVFFAFGMINALTRRHGLIALMVIVVVVLLLLLLLLLYHTIRTIPHGEWRRLKASQKMI
jgi:hypothetical protein